MTTRTRKTAPKAATTASIVSPVMILGAMTVLGGLAYLIWTKREKINQFITEQDFHPIDQIGEYISEGKEKFSELLHAEEATDA